MNGLHKNTQRWLAFMKRVNRLYEDKHGSPGNGADKAKAAHFIKWRFGPQALIDAVARIKVLEDECGKLEQQLSHE